MKPLPTKQNNSILTRKPKSVLNLLDYFGNELVYIDEFDF